jgi:hypothetical protein
MRGKASQLTIFGALVLLAFFFTGCGSGGGSSKNPLESPERRHIMQMANVYRGYLSAHNHKPPANPAALKEWAKSQPKEALDKWITEPIDTALVSPRDGEPYQFVPPPKRKLGPQVLQVYEKTGVKGKHYTSGESGGVGELTDEQLQDALQGTK